MAHLAKKTNSKTGRALSPINVLLHIVYGKQRFKASFFINIFCFVLQLGQNFFTGRKTIVKTGRS
jgi:hypothetical protein